LARCTRRDLSYGVYAFGFADAATEACGTHFWQRDLANEMEIEDGAIWVYGVGEDGIQAFTDFGIENLIELRPDVQGKPRVAFQ
jgi:hypothetical protein